MSMKKNTDKELFLEKARREDVERLIRLLTLSFGFSSARAQEYLENLGLECFRVLRRSRSTEMVGCAGLIKTGHIFGGKPVSAVNIAHVALAPEARGTGGGLKFIELLCTESRSLGASMVTLFASTRPAYRKAGFGFGGHEIVFEAQTQSLPTSSSLRFSHVDLDDPRLREAYENKAREGNGLLARTAAHWKELLREPKHALAAYVHVSTGGDFLAYGIVDTSDKSHLLLRDWYAGSQELAVALLAFISRFRSVFPLVRWHGSLVDRLILALPDKGWTFAVCEEWMAQILDPISALTERGYKIASTDVCLVIRENETEDAALTLSVRNHVGHVTTGLTPGLPKIVVERRGLAGLFTGLYPPTELARLGMAIGDAGALYSCDAVFSGPSPWVAEHF
jgi:predicted acetyltransferase